MQDINHLIYRSFFMSSLVPTERVFRGYQEIPSELPADRQELTPTKPRTMYCSVFVLAVALGALGGANFAANQRVPNQNNFIAGIFFCSASGITLLALAIIAAKCPLKQNPSERV